MTEQCLEVQTNVLIPGFVMTPMSESLPSATQERLRAAAPLRRDVRLSEVARGAVEVLLSSLRGRVSRVSGGLLETPL